MDFLVVAALIAALSYAWVKLERSDPRWFRALTWAFASAVVALLVIGPFFAFFAYFDGWRVGVFTITVVLLATFLGHRLKGRQPSAR
jgi:MFS family permease